MDNFFSSRSASSTVFVQVRIFVINVRDIIIYVYGDGKSISRNVVSLNILVHECKLIIINIKQTSEIIFTFWVFIFWLVRLLREQWRIQGLVWVYRFSRSRSRKEAWGQGVWVTGARSLGKRFIFTFRKSSKHAWMFVGLIVSSMKMFREHQNQ